MTTPTVPDDLLELAGQEAQCLGPFATPAECAEVGVRAVWDELVRLWGRSSEVVPENPAGGVR